MRSSNYDLDWVPKAVWDSRTGAWKEVLDATPYANPNKGDFARAGTAQDFSGDAFTNTSERFIAYKEFQFFAKGLDNTPVEVNTASSIELLEFLLVEFHLGTTDQLLQRRPSRVVTLLKSRDEHYWDLSATPIILPPGGTLRVSITGEVPAALFGGVVQVRVYLTALGAQLRVK